MRQRRQMYLFFQLLIMCLLCTCVPRAVTAQEQISWSVVGCSGVITGADNNLRCMSTAGQPIIGLGSDGTNAISQGFWTPALIPSSVDIDIPVAGAFQLRNYPNPFATTTTIAYHLYKSGRVRLRITDMLGAPTKTLVDAVEEAGDHSVEWNGHTAGNERAAAGLYLYVLTVQSADNSMGDTRTDQHTLMLVR